jgi:hypothetical protein
MQVYWPWLGVRPTGLSLEGGLVTYDNLEEIEFPEGFDPDTLMPLKIVVHRRSKQL